MPLCSIKYSDTFIVFQLTNRSIRVRIQKKRTETRKTEIESNRSKPKTQQQNLVVLYTSLIWTVLQWTPHSFFQFRIVSLPWFQPFEYCYIPSERETVSQNHTKRFVKWQRIFSRIQQDSNKIQIKNQYATIHGECRNGWEVPAVLCIAHKMNA